MFALYASFSIAAVAFLVVVVAPEWGTSNLLVYIAICSIMGSLSVMSCKGLGIAVKLTLEGSNQFLYPETYFCILVRFQHSPALMYQCFCFYNLIQHVLDTLIQIFSF